MPISEVNAVSVAPLYDPTVKGISIAKKSARLVLIRNVVPAGYNPVSMQEQLDSLVPQAEELVFKTTGLRSKSPTNAKVVSREEWVDANLASVGAFIGPALAARNKNKSEPSDGWKGSIVGLLPKSIFHQLDSVGEVLFSTQMGLVLAYFSSRVLGQYEYLHRGATGLTVGDVVYFVGPNMFKTELQYGFQPKQFRLWLALHEITHRCQFTAVPWMREYFLSLVDTCLAPLHDDPTKFLEDMQKAVERIKRKEVSIEEFGLAGIFASPEQRLALGKAQALMSLLEGHGDVTMNMAGATDIPGAKRFEKTIHARRNGARGVAKALNNVLGMQGKMRQYKEGEDFVNAVMHKGGKKAFDRVWDEPASLPSLIEIRSPTTWLSRMGLG